MDLNGQDLATKLYWFWCSQKHPLLAKILTFKYLGRVDSAEVARFSLEGKHSMIWGTIKGVPSLSTKGYFVFLIMIVMLYSCMILGMEILPFFLLTLTCMICARCLWMRVVVVWLILSLNRRLVRLLCLGRRIL